MVFITGDCHGDWKRFASKSFPEQKEMTRDDIVIVCGDFGIWTGDHYEDYWLDWLAEKSFTLVFVDGNHENFDRLYGDEFETVDFHGGKAHKIRENIYHLMRGYVFEFDGKKFFAFGGARSHDISDGILREEDYPNLRAMLKDYNKRYDAGAMIRVEHISWWEQEMPSPEEMEFGRKTLEEHNKKVDYIITHCAPFTITMIMGGGIMYDNDVLTQYFDEIMQTVDFNTWYFGHYHMDKAVFGQHICLYRNIERLI